MTHGNMAYEEGMEEARQPLGSSASMLRPGCRRHITRPKRTGSDPRHIESGPGNRRVDQVLFLLPFSPAWLSARTRGTGDLSPVPALR